MWNIYRDERNDSAIENNYGKNTNNNKTITSKFFEFKIKRIGRAPVDKNTLDTGVVVPLKYLNDF